MAQRLDVEQAELARTRHRRLQGARVDLVRAATVRRAYVAPLRAHRDAKNRDDELDSVEWRSTRSTASTSEVKRNGCEFEFASVCVVGGLLACKEGSERIAHGAATQFFFAFQKKTSPCLERGIFSIDHRVASSPITSKLTKF